MGVNARRSFLTALGLLLVLAMPAAAQNGTIVGRVTAAESGGPIAGADVAVRTAEGGIAGRTLSNQDGRYRVTGIAPGSYTVSISAVGYGTHDQSGVQVTSGQTATVDVALQPVPFDFDPIVVTSGRRPEKALTAVQHSEVVSDIDIQVRPAVTPVDHLKNVPAVDIITNGVQSTFVVVRGFNNIFSGALHTLTDNRIAGIPSLRVNLMHFIPQTNDDIDRMEVVLGPGSALYGPNTANGVLHILTKSPLDEQGTTVSLTGGERSVGQGLFRTAHMLGENFGFKVSGQYVRANEWEFRDAVEDSTKQLALTDRPRFIASLPRDVDGTPLTAAEIQQRIDRIAARNFDIERFALDARADWRATANLGLVFSAGRTMASKGIEMTGIGAAQAVDWAYSYYQARASSGQLFAQAYLNTSDAGETFLLRTGGPIIDRSKVFVGQLQHGLTTWNGRQTFTYGGDFIRTMPETEGTINGSNEDDDNYDELGAYLQSRTDLSRQFSLTLAGRVDKHSELEDAVWSPRAGLVFTPVPEQSFRVTYNRAFSTPTSLNLFLDIDGGPAGALGPFGFRVRAQGPGDHGFSFYGAGGQLHGVRSPFAASATTITPITAAAIYDLQVTGLQRAAGASIPAAVIAAMRNFRNDPAFAALTLSLLNPITQAVSPFAGAQIPDVPAIKESISNVFEVGYKGIIGQRLLLAADVWREKKTNFTSPLVVRTPLVLLNPQQLGGFLVPRLTQVFIAAGLPAAQAQAQATAIAGNIARIPGGVISSPDISARGADLLATYVNFGEIELTGVDLGATALLTDRLQLGVTGSLVSDDHFDVPLAGQDTQIVALNAPRKKASVHLAYRQAPVGWNGEVRVRYTDEFPVNSADFVGIGCITPDPNDDDVVGECIKSYALFDVTAGYAFPTIPGASVSLTVQNLFDEAYQSFLGVPAVGRMALLRVKYEFGGRR
jgi:iron complex outermembrane receptor protein